MMDATIEMIIKEKTGPMNGAQTIQAAANLTNVRIPGPLIAI